MFRLDKRKIFLLYHYYLLGRIQKKENDNEERVIWLNKCLEKENFLSKKINKKLKVGWEFSHLPPLERAILVYSGYELLFGENNNGLVKMIISQTINFSKAYLEENKYKYINKVLDLISKEEKILE